MGGQHLTCRNGAWIFQRRVPSRLSKHFPSAPVRVTIGPVGKRIALQAARQLWVVAEEAFRKLGATTAMGADPAANGRALRGQLDAFTAAFLPTLVALDFDGSEMPPEVARPAVSASLDGIVDVCLRDAVGTPVPEPHRTVALRHYGGLPKDEALARQHLGLPPAPRPAEDPTMSRVLAALDTLRQQGEANAQELRTLKESQDPKARPLFSDAADRYYDEMATAHGVIRRGKGALTQFC